MRVAAQAHMTLCYACVVVGKGGYADEARAVLDAKTYGGWSSSTGALLDGPRWARLVVLATRASMECRSSGTLAWCTVGLRQRHTATCEWATPTVGHAAALRRSARLLSPPPPMAPRFFLPCPQVSVLSSVVLAISLSAYPPHVDPPLDYYIPPLAFQVGRALNPRARHLAT